MKKPIILFAFLAFIFIKPDHISSYFNPSKNPRMPIPSFCPSYSKILRWAKEKEENYPELVRIVKYGYSLKGKKSGVKNLFALELSNKDEDFKKSVIIHSLIHPRELITVFTIMKITDFILEKASEGRGYWHELLSKVRIIVIPVVNPDGYGMVMKGWNWRKNVHVYKRISLLKSPNSYGVNINQNFNVNFAKIHKISSLEWGGPYPFSEPETRYLRDYLKDKKLALSIALHSYGKYIAFPWWGKLKKHIKDYKKHLKIGKAALKYFKGYRLQEGCPYAVTGNYGDWVYKKFGAITFTVEIGKSFNPPKKLALKWRNEAFRGILFLISKAYNAPFTHQALKQ